MQIQITEDKPDNKASVPAVERGYCEVCSDLTEVLKSILTNGKHYFTGLCCLKCITANKET